MPIAKSKYRFISYAMHVRTRQFPRSRWRQHASRSWRNQRTSLAQRLGMGIRSKGVHADHYRHLGRPELCWNCGTLYLRSVGLLLTRLFLKHAGDLWYFPPGQPHSLQATADDPAGSEFLLVRNSSCMATQVLIRLS